MLELLVVDEHSIFRMGLKRLLSDEPDMRVTGEASDGASALLSIRSHAYGMVVLDINMKGRSGLETLAAIRAEQPRLPVIMLSSYEVELYAAFALRGGANAYLSKNAEPEEIVRVIREVGRGTYLSPSVAGTVLEQAPHVGSHSPHERLTPRETQVVMRIVKGQSISEIGLSMCLSVKTISTYRTRALEKLGLTSNAQLVQYAVQNGLVD
ncbi:MAG TPA: response regulator transcription factor [Ramlibacter sp.]|nr:response regulator transcription factor [Ramlibacter sp.]